VLGRPCIDDQWDSSVEFIENMLSCGWTDTAEPVRAGRSKWFPKCEGNLRKNGMRADSHCDCIETGRHNVRNDFALRHYDGKRSRPKMISKLFDQFPLTAPDGSNAFNPIAPG